MSNNEFDQNARIALLQSYSSNKNSWATVALTCLIAIFLAIQVRTIVISPFTIIIDVLIAILLSQIVLSASRYIYFGQAFILGPPNRNYI